MTTVSVGSTEPAFHKALTYLNRYLLFLQVFILGGLAMIMSSRDRFQEISDSLYEGADQLMNSALVDIFVRNESMVLLLVVLAGLYIKEKRLEKIGTRITSNIVGVVLIGLFASLLIQRLYLV